MEKFCVFCGQFPESKNKEHVLPEWLIKMTGDPKRIATFGVDFAKQPFAPRQFSFDALTFPACSECNGGFSHLETATKPIVHALLSHQAVSASDLILLLDWLDKVRVGLWLGYFYLDKNPLGITPSFHIQNRVGQLDRMVTIIKLAEPSVGLTFIGPESKFYQLSPTCFALRVNGLCLVNTSGISLCSRRLGFPFAEPVRIRDDHKLEVSFQRGSERVMYPVERSPALPTPSPYTNQLVSLKDREQTGELTSLLLAASRKSTNSIFPTVSIIDETGNFKVIDKRETLTREIDALVALVKSDPNISAKELAREVGDKERSVKSKLAKLGWHRSVGGSGGGSPWHEDIGGRCPYDLGEPKTLDDAVTYLKRKLEGTAPDGECVPEADVFQNADKLGIPDMLLAKARKRLGVVVGKLEGEKVWSLPAVAQPTSEAKPAAGETVAA